VNHIELSRQGEAVKQFFLTLPPDPEGAVVELDGQVVARVFAPVAKGDGEQDASLWTDAKNGQRWQLIDKEIDGRLTPEETRELDLLQRQFHKHLRQVAPLPLEDARRLQQELLAKANGASQP
jgi:hypothetical protein